jgi:hypothetical protein
MTSIFHLMGGVGTSCAAFAAEKFEMFDIVPYQWAYQLFVLITTVIAILMIRATVQFAKSKEKAYRQAVILLVVGLVITLVHVFVSRAVRGASMPNDARAYLNILTLIVLLLFNIPSIRNQMGFDAPDGGADSGAPLGIVAVLMGFVLLTIHIFAGPTHTWDGINYADIYHIQFQILGWFLVLTGTLANLQAIFKVPEIKPSRQIETV